MGLLHWNSMSMTDRAQGVLYGQVIGDSLGSLVEFASPDTIAADTTRSEERRVGKECRSRWSPYH